VKRRISERYRKSLSRASLFLLFTRERWSTFPLKEVCPSFGRGNRIGKASRVFKEDACSAGYLSLLKILCMGKEERDDRGVDRTSNYIFH
jgi:hypothetical protein